MNIYRVYSCIYFFYLSIMFDNCWYSYSLLFSLYQRNLSGCQHTSPLDCFRSSWLGNYTWTLKTWWEEFCIKTSEFYLLLNCWYLLLVQITTNTKQTIILLVVEMVPCISDRNQCNFVILSFQVGILYDKTEMGRDLTLKYISDNLCPPKVIAGLIF